jgi:hypothetical protein
MHQEIRRHVVVQPGGRIEICAPELRDGMTAEVVIRIEGVEHIKKGLAWHLGRAAGAFDSPEEVDRFLDRERSRWQ